MSQRIFISYKRVDKKIVFPIKDYIEKNVGETCWIDLDGIESDAQFVNVIMNAIDNASVFLFMYSQAHSITKDYSTDWTVRELNYAQKKGKRIVFINIDKYPLSDYFLFMFPQKQQVDATSKEAMQKLCHDLKAWLNISHTPTLLPIEKTQSKSVSENNYDIFISYKCKSLPMANNLYYRLTTRGYSTFFHLEEIVRDNFNTQLLKYIENAKDVFVILEEGSLDACKRDDWEKDWFCHEIAFALEKGKNIIPILLNGYTMPPEDFFPNELKKLRLKQAPEFNYTFFEAYLDKLVEKGFLISTPNNQDKATSVFKFYSNEDCQVFKDGKLVCRLEGMSDEPYYLPVRKGDYQFKLVNEASNKVKSLNKSIDNFEDKIILVKWRRFKGWIVSLFISFGLLAVIGLSVYLIHDLPKMNAKKMAEEALTYCKENKGYKCVDALLSSKTALENAAVPQDDSIMIEINKRIH